MKFLVFLAFVVLCWIFCANSNEFVMADETANRAPESDPANKTEPTLIDLNTDCMLLIFDHLDLVELLNMMQVNVAFNAFARDVFNSRYREFIVKMNFTLPEQRVQSQSNANSQNIVSRLFHFFGMTKQNEKVHLAIPSYVDNGSEIEVMDPALLAQIFKLVSPIRKLTLNSAHWEYSARRMKLIGDIISENPENLEEIEFDWCENGLKFIRKPLLNIKSVTIRGVFSPYGQTLSMNMLFPAIRRLNLDFLRHYAPDIDYHMPHLEHLQITNAPYIKHRNELFPLMNVIKANPQIRSIDLFNSLPGFLFYTADWLSKLENLTLHHCHLPRLNSTFAIVFGNVVKFSMELSLSSPGHLYLPKLEELHINLVPRLLEMWLTFLSVHKPLKRFHLKYSDLSDEHFQRLAEYLFDLDEMSVSHTGEEAITTQALIQFLKKHDKLQRFQLNSCTRDDKILFRRSFSNRWTIETIYDGILLRRK